MNTALAANELELKTESTLFQKIFAVSQSKSMVILRLALGIVFFAHGSQKLLGWFGGYGWAGTVGFFVKSFGIPAPLAELSILVEFFGGLAIILGLLTRSAALALAINVLVAMFKVHLPNGFFLNGANYGIEYVFTLFMIALYLLVKGAGAFSIDKAIYNNLKKN